MYFRSWNTYQQPRIKGRRSGITVISPIFEFVFIVNFLYLQVIPIPGLQSLQLQELYFSSVYIPGLSCKTFFSKSVTMCIIVGLMINRFDRLNIRAKFTVRVRG